MNRQPDEVYFEGAQSWALEADHQVKRSRRTAWIIAGCATGVVILQALAFLLLLPLKETETVMLLVDRTTGYVQEIDPSDAATIRADDAMLQSLLAQYVTAREKFDRQTVEADYRKAALWSSGLARSTYLNNMSRQDQSSPLNTLRQGEARSVEVKSVTQTGIGTALVRFDTFIERNPGRLESEGSWISMIDYQFSNAPMSYEDRLINPLGLQITGYRRDAERPSDTLPVANSGQSTQALPVTP